jgi:hypothetical protein
MIFALAAVMLVLLMLIATAHALVVLTVSHDPLSADLSLRRPRRRPLLHTPASLNASVTFQHERHGDRRALARQARKPLPTSDAAMSGSVSRSCNP